MDLYYCQTPAKTPVSAVGQRVHQAASNRFEEPGQLTLLHRASLLHAVVYTNTDNIVVATVKIQFLDNFNV